MVGAEHERDVVGERERAVDGSGALNGSPETTRTGIENVREAWPRPRERRQADEDADRLRVEARPASRVASMPASLEAARGAARSRASPAAVAVVELMRAPAGASRSSA